MALELDSAEVGKLACCMHVVAALECHAQVSPDCARDIQGATPNILGQRAYWAGWRVNTLTPICPKCLAFMEGPQDHA